MICLEVSVTQSGESVESVVKTKKATVSRICRKGGGSGIGLAQGFGEKWGTPETRLRRQLHGILILLY